MKINVLQLQFFTFGTLLQRGGVQLAEVHDLGMVGVVADHEALGDVAGDIQHHALFVGRGEVVPGALAVAAGQKFECDNAPNFIKADVLAGHVEGLGTFDMILSNPPYVMDSEKALMRRNVLDHEPWLALFVSDDDPLVFYRAVAAWAKQLLKPDGIGIVEINEALGPETASVFSQAGFTDATVIRDLSDRHRFVRFSRSK